MKTVLAGTLTVLIVILCVMTIVDSLEASKAAPPLDITMALEACVPHGGLTAAHIKGDFMTVYCNNGRRVILPLKTLQNPLKNPQPIIKGAFNI